MHILASGPELQAIRFGYVVLGDFFFLWVNSSRGKGENECRNTHLHNWCQVWCVMQQNINTEAVWKQNDFIWYIVQQLCITNVPILLKVQDKLFHTVIDAIRTFTALMSPRLEEEACTVTVENLLHKPLWSCDYLTGASRFAHRDIYQ